MKIKYAFHIGERCQFLAFLKTNKIVSGDSCFSGIYVSFDSAMEIIRDRFENFAENIVKYKISDLHAGIKNTIQFIDVREDKINSEDKKKIESKLLAGRQDFFFKENFYKTYIYCLHLKYTDIDNIGLNDSYFTKSKRYCFMPNSDYSLPSMKQAIDRRRNRFLQCLDENPEQMLMLYMDKLTNIANLNDRINEIVQKYKYPQLLFFFIPFYTKDDSKLVSFKKSVNNIVFSCVQFASIDYQKVHNPNDDNCLGLYKANFEKMKSFLLESYDLSNLSYFY